MGLFHTGLSRSSWQALFSPINRRNTFSLSFQSSRASPCRWPLTLSQSGVRGNHAHPVPIKRNRGTAHRSMAEPVRGGGVRAKCQDGTDRTSNRFCHSDTKDPWVLTNLAFSDPADDDWGWESQVKFPDLLVPAWLGPFLLQTTSLSEAWLLCLCEYVCKHKCARRHTYMFAQGYDKHDSFSGQG